MALSADKLLYPVIPSDGTFSTSGRLNFSKVEGSLLERTASREEDVAVNQAREDVNVKEPIGQPTKDG